MTKALEFYEDKSIHAIVCEGMSFVAHGTTDDIWEVELLIDNEERELYYKFVLTCMSEDDARYTMEEVAAGIRSRMQSTKEKK